MTDRAHTPSIHQRRRHFLGYNAFTGQKSLSVLSTPNIHYAVAMTTLVISQRYVPHLPKILNFCLLLPPTFPLQYFLQDVSVVLTDVQKNCRHLSHEAHHDEKHLPSSWSATSLLSIFLKYMPAIICNCSAQSQIILPSCWNHQQRASLARQTANTESRCPEQEEEP